MPVSQQAIDKFLAWRPAMPAPVKGRPVDELVERIEMLCRASFTPKSVPRPHQLEALCFALEQRRALLFLKQRLGKTAVALYYAEMLRKSGDFTKKGLVIVPVPVIGDVWEYETEMHTGLKAVAVATQDGQAALDEALASDADLIVMSWYTLQSFYTAKGLPTEKKKGTLKVRLAELIAFAAHFDLVVIDEIHLAKTPASLRFQIGNTLTWKCPSVLGLTGTPHGRNPYDLWAQAYLVDRGQTLGFNYQFFRRAFGRQVANEFAAYGYVVEFDPAKMPLLERRIGALAISYGWEGYLEVPEISRNIVRLHMTGRQAKLYGDAIADLVRAGNSKVSINNIFIRLRQISSGFLPFKTEEGLDRTIHVSSAKLEWIQELVEEAPPEVRIVVFHDFTETGMALTKHLDKLKIPHRWLYGGTVDKGRAVRDFQDGSVNVLVAHPQSGGMGIDLSMADYMVFLESPVSAVVRQQAEARPIGDKRNGRPLVVDDLVCSPVEERILEYVQQGKDLLAELVYHGADLKGFF